MSQRKSIVEPVFSALRGIQGLERFRRKGLSAVKREFTLHAMAYNLSRAVALILGIITMLTRYLHFPCFYISIKHPAVKPNIC
ncbi:transposase [Xenorhabdus bovienii]|nr:transposase [Xenorhabdus bovienii]MDE9462749.1 transposase [Xenorhabdus bovienii]MDE9470554.1 transposase [Xenorhabdus bovienii]